MLKFHEWFKKLRESKGLTQTETAKQMKLSSPTISRWEDGTEPRAGHLRRICKWAPVSADKLLNLLDSN